MARYESDNIFAKILRGEIPNHTVYENEDTLVFMDVMPMSRGHCLVVPKAESRNLLDADPAIFGKVMKVVQKVANAANTALNADGVVIQQFNEEPAGQTVFHLHFHVVPVYAGVALARHADRMADNGELAALAKKIAGALR